MSTEQAAIDRLAERALDRYGLDGARPFGSERLGELDVPDRRARRRTFALRVHRPGYHTAEEIESELDWIDALRDDVVETAHMVASADGSRVTQLATPELGERNVVLFEWLTGEMPERGHRPAGGFRTLGAVSARMHDHARRWSRPSSFRASPGTTTPRSAPRPLGTWQDGLGMGREELDLLGRLDAAIRTGSRPTAALRAVRPRARRHPPGQPPRRRAHVRVIDFDDCGFSWFMYDFATTVSFFEDHPQVPELKDAWVEATARSPSSIPWTRPSWTRS